MEGGFIKLHRSIKDCWLWQDDEPFTKRDAWIDLLLMVNYTDKKILIDGVITTIKAGQIHTSILKLSERWKWDRKKTKKFLDVLESDEMITTKRSTHGTTLTLVNWEKYQHRGSTDGATDGQPMDNGWVNQGSTTAPQHKNIKNNKNIKNGKKEPAAPDDESKSKLKQIEKLYFDGIKRSE